MKHKYRSSGEILDYCLTPVSQGTVRRAYKKWRVQRGLPYQCDMPACSLHTPNPMWQGKSICLTFDHIDGNRKNNRTENLRFPCPNCDAQLDTRGGNRGRIKDAMVDSYESLSVTVRRRQR